MNEAKVNKRKVTPKWQNTSQQYQGRVVLRGRSVVDETGGFAVLTEQGAPASHISAAEVLDTISQLPGISGDANGAVSAYTQVKMSDAFRLLEVLETGCPTVRATLG